MIYWLQCVMVSRPEILLLFVVGRLQGKSYHYANLPGQRLLYYMCTFCNTYPHQRGAQQQYTLVGLAAVPEFPVIPLINSSGLDMSCGFNRQE